MRLFCLPAVLVEIHIIRSEWAIVVSNDWELDVIAAKNGRTVARWLDRCGRRIADIEPTKS